MSSRYEAYMDGTSLSSLDTSIRVLDIQQADVTPTFRTVSIANTPGAIITKQVIDKSAVDIIFEIHKYNPADRLAVAQKVQKWAQGAILTTSDRTNQRLHAVCESFPNPNAKGWTEPLTIRFGGYNPPYWENTTATTATINLYGTETVDVPGNAPEALVEATVTASYTITEITFTLNGKTIKLEGLSVANGDTVTMGYNDQILTIKHGSTSVLDKVTSSSADVLKAVCGASNTFGFDADGAAVCVFSVRGCWL